MKKIYIVNVETIKQERNAMKYSTDMILEGGDEMRASDGDHTFEDLYEHRYRLWIAVCKFARFTHHKVWCSTQHADGSKYDDYFLLGIDKEAGKQISYHLPARYWNDVCEFAEVLEKAPEWDGHTSDDVLERLKVL